MLFNNAYKGAFLKAADLGGKTLRLLIASIQMEQLGDETKVVVSFRETDQKLVLNKTNASILRDAWGDDMDEWCGKRVLLKADKTPFNGKLVPCVRVEVPKENAAPAKAEADDNVPY